MIQDRYATVNGKRVEFEDLKKGDNFKLYESDGEFVEHCTAAGNPYINGSGIWSIETNSIIRASNVESI